MTTGSNMTQESSSSPDRPSVGDIHRPTTGGSFRGRKCLGRKVISCYDVDDRFYIDYVDIGDVDELPRTVLQDSFLKWSRRVEAVVERTSIVVSTTEVSEEILPEKTEPVLTADELEATVAPPLEEIPPGSEEPEPVIGDPSATNVVPSIEIIKENEPQDDFSQIGAALRAELERKQAIKLANITRPVAARQAVVTPEEPQPQNRPSLHQLRTTPQPEIYPMSAMRAVSNQALQQIQTRAERLQKSEAPQLDQLFQKQESVVVFFDGANHDATMQQMAMANLVRGPDALDYRAFYAFLRQQCYLMRIYYYIGLVVDRPEHQRLRARLDWMAYNNIDVKIKHAERAGSGHIVKSNVDVELALDMYRIATSSPEGGRSNVNHVVLFSGDSDFTYPLELIKSRGVRVTVIGSLLAGTLSDKLRRVADQFVELRDLVDHLNSIHPVL